MARTIKAEMNPIYLPQWARKPARLVLRMWFAAAIALGCSLIIADLLQRQGNLNALNLSSKLAPFDARTSLLLADVEPDRARDHLARVRQLNPEYAPAQIRLALALEAAGNFAEAERELLDAANSDHTFLPRWTLANFYFRQSRLDEFWKYTRAATDSYQGDLTGVFQLCLRAEPDPARIIEKLGELQPAARLDLARVLLNQRNYLGLAPLAGRIATDGLRDSRELLLEACHQAGIAQVPHAAVQIWNALVESRQFLGQPLAPTFGQSLNNGQFEHALSGACFDWKPTREDGISIRSGPPVGLRVTFSGHQNETVTLLEQWLPLLPVARYELSWAADQHLPAGASPVEWFVDSDLLAPLSQPKATFAANGRSLVRLYLRIERKPGATKPDGSVEIRHVSLRML